MKPDFRSGYPLAQLVEGQAVTGTVGEDDVILARKGDEVFAVSAWCSHYHGPLAEGLIVDDTVRCPWHHACFSLRTGEAVRAPALDAITCWRVEREGGSVFVREKLDAAASRGRARANAPDSIVIVGGGAAGLAAADMLRREGYDGPLTMISADDSPPCDRPNLSKDYLAGTAQEDWIPLRAPSEYYDEQRIDLLLNSRVSSLDLQHKRVQLDGGGSTEYGVAAARHRRRPGAPRYPRCRGCGQVHYLRTFADSKAIVARGSVAPSASWSWAPASSGSRWPRRFARGTSRCMSWRPRARPLERVMGPEIGAFIREVSRITRRGVPPGPDGERHRGTDRDADRRGTKLDADFIVVGVGCQAGHRLRGAGGAQGRSRHQRG